MSETEELTEQRGATSAKEWREAQNIQGVTTDGTWVQFPTMVLDQLLEAYASSRLVELTEQQEREHQELEDLRASARNGLLKFTIAGDVGCFADKMRQLLQGQKLDELNRAVTDFFNYAKDQTERGYEEIRIWMERAEAASSRLAELPNKEEWEANVERVKELSRENATLRAKLERLTTELAEEKKKNEELWKTL